jgi:hypothetical protein
MNDASKKSKKSEKRKDPHAVSLGKRGGRKGGVARAKSMTAEERKESAKKAAEARWSVPEASYAGELKIGNVVLPCAVLKDGRRVLTQQGFNQAMGRRGNLKLRPENEGFNLPPFLLAKSLKPFISQELMASSTPVVFRTLPGVGGRGGRTIAKGYLAEFLPMVCRVYLDARDAGALSASQLHVAQTADILVRALAETGIIALVDEATGYQYDRARDELQTILRKFIRESLLPWTKKFSNDFFRELYRIHGWEFAEGKAARPGCIGHFINAFIYKSLPPGVLEELQNRNPVSESGRRKHKHFQLLTEDTGHPALDKQITSVATLMAVSNDKPEFVRLFKKFNPRRGDQVDLELFEAGLDLLPQARPLPSPRAFCCPAPGHPASRIRVIWTSQIRASMSTRGKNPQYLSRIARGSCSAWIAPSISRRPRHQARPVRPARLSSWGHEYPSKNRMTWPISWARRPRTTAGGPERSM